MNIPISEKFYFVKSKNNNKIAVNKQQTNKHLLSLTATDGKKGIKSTSH